MKSYGFVLEQVVLLSLPLTTLSSCFFVFCFSKFSIDIFPACCVCLCVCICVFALRTSNLSVSPPMLFPVEEQ